MSNKMNSIAQCRTDREAQARVPDRVDAAFVGLILDARRAPGPIKLDKILAPPANATAISRAKTGKRPEFASRFMTSTRFQSQTISV
jgi:hypothetical protein